jgi:hypothetical protein
VASTIAKPSPAVVANTGYRSWTVLTITPPSAQVIVARMQQAAGEPGDGDRRADRSSQDCGLSDDGGRGCDREAATDQSSSEIRPNRHAAPARVQAEAPPKQALGERALGPDRCALFLGIRQCAEQHGEHDQETIKVDQMGSSSAAASQTVKPMQVTRSGRAKRFRRARLGRWSGSAQIA